MLEGKKETIEANEKEISIMQARLLVIHENNDDGVAILNNELY